MRIINFKDYTASAAPLYIECKVLKLHDIINLKNCLFVHDFLTKSLPTCFSNYFHELKFIHDHDTRGSSLGSLLVPMPNTTTFGLNSIIYKSVQCWNDISNMYGLNLKELSRDSLKKKLTQVFLQN